MSKESTDSPTPAETLRATIRRSWSKGRRKGVKEFDADAKAKVSKKGYKK